MTSLRIDPQREHLHEATGIYVRVQRTDGSWGNADIAELTAESLTDFLRSRGEKNEWTEGVVHSLLGHER